MNKSAKKPKSVGKAAPKAGPPCADPVAAAMLGALHNDSVQLLNSDSMSLRIKGVVSTQCAALDRAIGRGGVPLSRLTLMYGNEGSGKTTLALHLLAEAQRLGGTGLYIDKECKTDPDYAAAIGVKTEILPFVQPGYLPEVIDLLNKGIEAAPKIREAAGHFVPIIVVLDSLNAARAKRVKKGGNGESRDVGVGEKHYPDEAYIWSEELPEMCKRASENDVALVFISQVRQKMNVMFGDPDNLFGGNAPRFHASLIMKVTRVGSIYKESEGSKKKIANKIEVECRKNQIAAPFRKASFQIKFGRGINSEASLVEECIHSGVLGMSGTSVVHDGKSLGKSRDNLAIRLRKDAALYDKLTAQFREKQGWTP